ncbi:MAG: hypothetical protein F4X14_17510 [Caldilineaceae bacterium SB0661_bin_32]|uniref:Uncharacterized protein n=1 Tax=Caldilineaceae bacterium SB0661_bin_32 TaxID=2605255 RepID=A0A6B1DAV8_9CHLR|nr:hypothetical protein [Caldilineaceae bacterium SB0661_bin_32]
MSKSRDSAGYGLQIPQILQKNYGFSPEAAQWAAESWFAALDRSPPQPNTSRNGSHTAFSDGPQLVLRRLLTDYGPALLENPARVHALLADLSGSNSRERFLLVQALRAHIPAELLVHHMDNTDQMQQLSHRFQTRYGFSAEAAGWAIESWSLSLKAALSGQDPALEEDRVAAKANARKLERERDAARETARQKTIARAAAESVVRQKTNELTKAESVVRQKERDLTAAREVARQRPQTKEIARQKEREVRETIVQILELDPLTPSEVEKIFGVSEEQAVFWLRQLQATGIIEKILLRRPPHFPSGFQVKGWSYTSVVATDKDKRAVGIAARQKVKEWRAAEAGARRPERERAAALSITQRLARERAAAESKTQQIAKERAKAESAAQQLAKECAAESSVAQRLTKKLAIAKTAVQQLARKQADAEKAACLKSKEWSSAAAATRMMVKKRTQLEATAKKTEEKSIEIILQNLKQNTMTSQEVTAILETEQEQAIELLKRLLSDNQIEITWSKRSPYAPCYKPVKHSSTPSSPGDQSAPRQSGCLLFLAIPGLLGLLALLG